MVANRPIIWRKAVIGAGCCGAGRSLRVRFGCAAVVHLISVGGRVVEDRRHGPTARWRKDMRWNGSKAFLAIATGHTVVTVAMGVGLWFMRDLAWGLWLMGVMAVFMAAYSAYMWWLGLQPFPALDPIPCPAKVIAIDRRLGFEDEPELVRVRVADNYGGRHWNSTLADLVPPQEYHRFTIGSQWSVYVFEKSRERVLLTEAHEDVLRAGYDLSGVRHGAERWPDHSGPKPGSPLLWRRFAAPTRRRTDIPA